MRLAPMRILVTGAYGLIGSVVVARLVADGHDLVGTGRDVRRAKLQVPDVAWKNADFANTSVEAWTSLLAGADAVVNCAGALQDSPRDDLRAVHVDGVRRLVEACRVAGVRRFVHISAAGLDGDADSAFTRTKQEAERVVMAAPIDWVILRPGLVLATAAYGGSALLRGLAALPWVVPTVHPSRLVQCISAADVADAVARALDLDEPLRRRIDLVHGDAMTLDTLLVALRRWLGVPGGRVVRLPAAIVRIAASAGDALGHLGWRPAVRTTTLVQLAAGVRGDGDAAERYLGLRPRSLQQMLARSPAGVQERWFARGYFLKPLVLATLCLFWLLSGAMGLLGLPAAVSTLTVAGVPLAVATPVVVAGSVLDIALALALAHRRTAMPALQGMLLVSAAYLVAGTVLRPDLWLDPLGPLLKILPAAALAAVALATLGER
jgi:uncharacterized protein YbjT (DUF2867 family)